MESWSSGLNQSRRAYAIFPRYFSSRSIIEEIALYQIHDLAE